MEGTDKINKSLMDNSKSDGSGLIDDTKDNLRQRSVKLKETKETDIKPLDIVHHSMLPQWLQDNEFLHNWHRPPLSSYSECFNSMFKLHTETGNIWTHFVGFVAFIVIMIYFLSVTPIVFEEKFIFSAFFVGAILCLGFSTLMHTFSCHSESVCKLVGKLDYLGISCLSMGSIVPWVYYVFYCDNVLQIIYISMSVILGTITIIISLCEKFSTSEYRPMRALAFVIFGLSAVIPEVHYMFIMDWNEKINTSSLQCSFLVASLYISGAGLYAARIPERLFPGKCDLWFQSHQIFHVFVVAAAFLTYFGLKEIAVHRHMYIECGDF